MVGGSLHVFLTSRGGTLVTSESSSPPPHAWDMERHFIVS